jgi:hypothetical protein
MDADDQRPRGGLRGNRRDCEQGANAGFAKGFSHSGSLLRNFVAFLACASWGRLRQDAGKT